MKVPSRTTSRPNSIVCPACGELWVRGAALAGCDSCAGTVAGAVLRMLEQLSAPPGALGKHACACGDLEEMRPLHDGVFHCPASVSDVIPLDAGSTHTVHTIKEVTLWATSR